MLFLLQDTSVSTYILLQIIYWKFFIFALVL